MASNKKDATISALEAVHKALKPLDPGERQRVLASVYALLEIDESQPQTKSSSLSVGLRPKSTSVSPPRPVAIRELIQEKKPTTHPEFITLFAYYREKHQNLPTFSRTALAEYYPTSHEAPPANFDRDFVKAVKRGWIHEDGDNSYITSRGLEASNVSQRQEVTLSVCPEYLGDLNVHFQRILVATERAAIRKRYDEEINAILKKYTADLVVPLMQGNAHAPPANPIAVPAKMEAFQPTAFVGHSFDDADAPFAQAVIETLEALGITVVTGEKPKADKISDKVKRQIDGQHIFVGIFTRRHKLEGTNSWTTSAWVLDEKAYAYGRGRKLILLKEADVESIGGIQGDYEFLSFTRENFHEVIVKLIQLFILAVKGLQN